MNNNSKIKMICFISDYFFWDDTIHEHALKFHENYSIFPNIMLASKITWNKIDEHANIYNPENIMASDEDMINYEENDKDIKSISTFNTDSYSLEFCLDEKANKDYFILVFDEDPIFDGEPCEDTENDDAIIYKRIA